MATQFDTDSLDRLLAQGKISQETYDRVINKPTPSFDSSFEEPLDTSVDTTPLDVGVDTTPLDTGIDTTPLEQEDQNAEPPVDLGGVGRFPGTLPDPLGTANKSDVFEAPVMISPPVIPTADIQTGQVQTIRSQEKEATEKAKEAQLEIEAGIEKEKEAQGLQLQVDQQKAQEAFNIQKEQQRIQSEFSIKEQEIRSEGTRQVEERLKKLDADVAELSQSKYEGYWENKSTGSKILGAISLALGTLGSSLSGGPNTALSIIDKAMDEDFNIYQSKVNNRIKAIEKSRLNVQSKRQLIETEILGLQRKKESDIKVLQSKINNLSNKFAQPEVQAKLELLNSQLDQKAAQTRLQFEKGLGKVVDTTIQRKLESIKIDPKTGKAVAEIDQALEVPGYGQARTKEEAKEFRKRKTSTDEAVAAQTRIEQIWKGQSKLNPTSMKDLAKLRTELGLIQGAMRLSLIGPGAVTDAEREFMNQLIGDPSKVFGFEDVEKAKLDTIIQKMKIGLDSEAKNVIVGYKEKVSSFPMTLRKGNEEVVVGSEQELQEAKAEGWQ
jgi:hypothetical protein